MAQPTVRDLAHANGRQVRAFSNKVFQQYPAALVESGDNLIRPALPVVATAAATADAVAYFVYLGRTTRRITAQKVLCAASGTVAAGAQTAEIGLFSSPTCPNRAAQTLTKIVATGTVDAFTSNGVKGNTTAFARDIDAGTQLWAGLRVSMATTPPTLAGLTLDMSCGAILSTAAATAFTSGTTYTGALIAHAITWQAPLLMLHFS